MFYDQIAAIFICSYVSRTIYGTLGILSAKHSDIVNLLGKLAAQKKPQRKKNIVMESIQKFERSNESGFILMRSGYTLAAVRETQPNDAEIVLMRKVIKEMHRKNVGDWLPNQKPKIRAKFNKFMETVLTAPTPDKWSIACADIAERFARDIIESDYYPVLRNVIDDSQGQFSDILHILSLHMQRANIMASLMTQRDEMPKLLKEIAKEDHVFFRPRTAKHELRKVEAAQPVTRVRMTEPLPPIQPARSCKPVGKQPCPFACFPGTETMETMSRTQFINHHHYVRSSRSDAYNINNWPTCL
jgi:hypothetical protein